MITSPDGHAPGDRGLFLPASTTGFAYPRGEPSTASAVVIQLALPGLPADRVYPKRRIAQINRNGEPTDVSDDPLLRSYLRRLIARGAAQKGATAYRYQLATVLRTAARIGGQKVDLGALFQDPLLLGRTLADDTACGREVRLSRWTLAQRRSAIRSFTGLMRPELAQLLGEDPHDVLDRALRGVAEQVGGGYRLTGGTPRRRIGHAPSSDTVAAVLAAASKDAGFAGVRNVAFLSILAASGTRVNALRQLDGSDCVVLPSGRIRIYLGEKGKAEPREIELSRELGNTFHLYVDAFNGHAHRHGWRVRVCLGSGGPIWQSSGRGRWSYRSIRTTLHDACLRAGVREFSPHDLRRAFATDATSTLPRHTVALAGGWKGVERLDDHYVRPRLPTLWEKLQLAQVKPDAEREDAVVGAAAVTL